VAALVDQAEIAKLIDHAILRPDLRVADVDRELDVAARYGVFSACVRPTDVSHAVEVLGGTGVQVSTVVGFPHGSVATAIKVAEAQLALEQGATELDMVLQISRLRSGLLNEVREDIAAVVEVAEDAVVKVILETALLDDEEIVNGCKAADLAGAVFVKTSTGFAEGGATDADLILMRSAVGPHMQVKASGGIKDLDTLLRMRSLGVTRFGTSATAAILEATNR
jgi:deoxyribose-phosphate aldolase